MCKAVVLLLTALVLIETVHMVGHNQLPLHQPTVHGVKTTGD